MAKKAKARAKNQKQREKVMAAGKPRRLLKVRETGAGWAEGDVYESKQQQCLAWRQPQVLSSARPSRALTHILSTEH